MTAESNADQPLDREGVFEIVRANLSDILEIDPASISEGQSFVDDLDADSLALIELVEALEEGRVKPGALSPTRCRFWWPQKT